MVLTVSLAGIGFRLTSAAGMVLNTGNLTPASAAVTTKGKSIVLSICDGGKEFIVSIVSALPPALSCWCDLRQR